MNNPGIRHIGPPVERAGKVQPISPAVVAGDQLVFVAGQVPMRNGHPAGADIASQADVVKTTVWLVDGKDYPGFNDAYAERFPAATAPARSTVISGLIAPVLVEIEAVALRRPA